MTNLISFHLLVRENNDNFIIWTYPTITDSSKRILLSKCFNLFKQTSVYFCLRDKDQWMHIRQFSHNQKPYAVVVKTTDFAYNKYKRLCDEMVKQYSKDGNPVRSVQLYLKTFVSGRLDYEENGRNICLDFNHKEEPKVKDLIKEFGLDFILIYTAVLLKRRIVVYHTNIDIMQQHMQSIIDLVPNRNIERVTYPCIDNVNSELRGHSFYLAGTRQEKGEINEKLYDIYVHAPLREISVSSYAKDVFLMTEKHKEICSVLINLAEGDLSEKKVVEEVAKKTEELTDLLKSFSTISNNNIKMITANDIKSKNLNSNLESFLFNLAVAENMMLL